MAMQRHSFEKFKNPTDITPTGHRCLVLMDAVPEVHGGVIHKLNSERAKEEMAQIEGRLIACGPYAWADYPEPFVQPGARVQIAKYAGVLVNRGDQKFRVLEDVEITAALADKGNST